MLPLHRLFYSLFLGMLIYACAPENPYEQFLRSKLGNDVTFWMRVHAAESLIDNGFSVDVQSVFKEALTGAGAEKIGALRTLAKSEKSQGDKYEQIGKEIFASYLDGTEERTRLVGLETMGKLNLKIKSEDIRKIADEGAGGMQTLAQWVVANNGSTVDQEQLASFLFSPDTLQFRYAAYALRFQKQISDGIYRQMKKKYDALDQGHPFRVYLSSALFVHAPESESTRFKNDLLGYVSGPTYARYEVYQALAKRGRPQDLEFVANHFNDPDDDVRISVAFAYLSIEK